MDIGYRSFGKGVAKDEPQIALHSLTQMDLHSTGHIPNIAYLLEPSEDAISICRTLIPALVGRKISQFERKIFSTSNETWRFGDSKPYFAIRK